MTSSAERARTRRACRATASSTIRPSASRAMPDPASSNRASRSWARATSSSLGVKTSLAIATWGGVYAGPADAEPGHRLGRVTERVEVGEVRGDRRDRRRDPGGGRGQDDLRPDVQELSSSPGPSVTPRSARRSASPTWRRCTRGASASSVTLSTADALSTSGTTRAEEPEKPSSRSRSSSSEAVSALATTSPVSAGASATARTSSARIPPGFIRTQTPTSRVGQVVEPVPDRPSGGLLACGRHGVLQVDDDLVGPAVERLGQLVGRVARDVERGTRQGGAILVSQRSTPPSPVTSRRRCAGRPSPIRVSTMSAPYPRIQLSTWPASS